VAAQLQEQYGFPHVSSGHLLRQEVKGRTAWGNEAQPYMERGDLVPDPTVLAVMRHRWLSVLSETVGFMLDGFPRTVNQARVLDTWLAERRMPVQVVLLFSREPEAIIERIVGRRSCPRCGRVYHVKNVPPRLAGQCDDCQVALVQRTDDTEAVMRRRFAIYSRETAPLESFYQQQGKIALVDAAQPAEARLAVVQSALTE